VLGGLAEFERSLILARTGEGRARAKKRGVRFVGNRSSSMRISAMKRAGAAMQAKRWSTSPAPTASAT
jgi:DNA invertase Pin-like site-specific DNA recombinase